MRLNFLLTIAMQIFLLMVFCINGRPHNANTIIDQSKNKEVRLSNIDPKELAPMLSEEGLLPFNLQRLPKKGHKENHPHAQISQNSVASGVQPPFIPDLIKPKEVHQKKVDPEVQGRENHHLKAQIPATPLAPGPRDAPVIPDLIKPKTLRKKVDPKVLGSIAQEGSLPVE